MADDEVVVHEPAAAERPARVRRYTGLAPDTEHDLDGVRVRTLPRPPGELLATVATVNDLHFGEEVCGMIEGLPSGPLLCSAPGEDPYPLMMNRAAVGEISALFPAADAVVAKGDLTTEGTRAELQAFLDCYGPAFAERLHYVRGNHDATGRAVFADQPLQEIRLPGVTLVLLDTAVEREPGGALDASQLDELDAVCAGADTPVLVLGHHHPWDPGSSTRSPGYFGINPDDSEALVEVVARRPAVIGYLAGHTHRNRVRHFAATGRLPWVEVSCVKDFPGAWAEYRVFEGGILQVHRRISTPPALAWTERTRAMFAGDYPRYAFGRLEDRCLALWPR